MYYHDDERIRKDQRRVQRLYPFLPLGDFYEMFFEDALTASRELEITLTGKDCGLEERAPCVAFLFMLRKLISTG